MDIREVFEQKIKIDSKVVSLETLFNNESRVNNTNFKPSYQRNYVWDDEKATYFIESILLGTEIPPLIYFRNVSKVEIIDGRQRYETILRYLNNEFKLKTKGLKKLNSSDFINKSCSDLSINYQDLIYETKIRIIEFSFNTKTGINEEVEDLVKKEIFKRYNSGITPLKTTEIEKAEFYYNDVNQMFKEQVLKDKLIEKDLKKLFHFERSSSEILLKKIRELLVISYIPIKYFSIEKSSVINLYYEHMFGEDSAEEIDFIDLKEDFIQKLNIIRMIYDKIEGKDLYNRLISECLYWILSILKNENIEINDVKKISSKIAKDLEKEIDVFSMDRSSFYNRINSRYLHSTNKCNGLKKS